MCDQVSLFEWSFGWNNQTSVYDKYSLNLCVYIYLTAETVLLANYLIAHWGQIRFMKVQVTAVQV